MNLRSSLTVSAIGEKKRQDRILQGPYGKPRVQSIKRIENSDSYELKFFPDAAGLYTINVDFGSFSRSTNIQVKSYGRAELCEVLSGF